LKFFECWPCVFVVICPPSPVFFSVLLIVLFHNWIYMLVLLVPTATYQKKSDIEISPGAVMA